MKLSYYLKKPSRIITTLMNKGTLRFISDKTAIKMIYKIRLGKSINLDNPKTFNEKLQWLKLNNRNPEYSRIVDKATFKDYIKEKLGDGYTVPILGKWDKFDDIDFSKLPDKFVLKLTMIPADS